MIIGLENVSWWSIAQYWRGPDFSHWSGGYGFKYLLTPRPIRANFDLFIPFRWDKNAHLGNLSSPYRSVLKKKWLRGGELSLEHLSIVYDVKYLLTPTHIRVQNVDQTRSPLILIFFSPSSQMCHIKKPRSTDIYLPTSIITNLLRISCLRWASHELWLWLRASILQLTYLQLQRNERL